MFGVYRLFRTVSDALISEVGASASPSVLLTQYPDCKNGRNVQKNPCATVCKDQKRHNDKGEK